MIPGLSNDFVEAARDARAELTWGRTPEQAEATLRKKYTPEAIAEGMRLAVQAHGSTQRRAGVLDLLVSAPLLSVGVAVAWFLASAPAVAPGARAGRGPGGIIGLGIAAGVYGIFRLVRGLDRLLRGARAE